jgi:hypothetical protein
MCAREAKVLFAVARLRAIMHHAVPQILTGAGILEKV